MVQREVLVDILIKNWYDGMTMGECADMLIKNNVIVPPVRIGQTVYIVDDYNMSYTHGIVKAIYHAEREKGLPLPYFVVGCDGLQKLRYHEIGKRVFLTEEEARRAVLYGR